MNVFLHRRQVVVHNPVVRPTGIMKQAEIQHRLRRQRRDRWLSWLPILGFVALCVCMPDISWNASEQIPLLAIVWGGAALACVAIAVVLSGRVQGFICPKCNRPFYDRDNWNVDNFRRSCIHCGLRLNGRNFED